MSEPDLEDRDPNNINAHIRVIYLYKCYYFNKCTAYAIDNSTNEPSNIVYRGSYMSAHILFNS